MPQETNFLPFYFHYMYYRDQKTSSAVRRGALVFLLYLEYYRDNVNSEPVCN